MPDSPPKSPPPPLPPSENPQIPEIQNPNPNSDSAEIDPPEKSQPSTLESENPPPKSPSEETQKNPDQESHPNDEKPRVFVDVDEEQEQQVDEELEREEEDEDYVEQEEQEEGITMNLSPLPKSLVTRNSKNAGSSVRRNKKRKKGVLNKAALQKRMQALSRVFKPIPFLPRKVADFPKHEENLRKLGLWDFAHLEFDRNIRVDLLVELIACFSSKNRCVYVSDCRLGVNRADLGRALKLPVGKVPVKKQAGDCEGESYPSEFLSFLEEFVSNWMVLHECDVWVTPNEIVNWMKLIKEGCPQKVDWAGLMWFMVEKELLQGSGLNECFYASHLQQLIKDQKGHLLVESPKLVVEKKVLEVILEDHERAGDVEMLDAEEASVGEEKSADQCPDPESHQKCQIPLESSSAADMADKGSNSDMARSDGDADMLDRDSDIMFDVSMVNGDNDINVAEKDGTGRNVEKDEDANRVNDEENVGINEADGLGYITNIDCAHDVEQSAGMSKDNMVDFEGCSGVAQGQWHLDVRKDGGQHFMQRCSMAGLVMSTEDATFDDAGEELQNDEGATNELAEDFEIRQKVTMDGTASRNFMQSFETGDLQYTSASLGGQSSLGLMPSRPENDVSLDDSSLFNHVGKREISFDHEISHHALDDNHKRRRIDGHWDQKPPPLGMCLDQLKHWVDKALMSHETDKGEAYQQANMAQFYAHQVAEKDAEIMQWRYKIDELERAKHAEVSRRDRELHLMNGVIGGYRRALKDTQRAFAEYRKRCKIPDEPVYKDAGAGGVVKSVMELEREMIKEEEEQRRTRYVLEQTYTTQINEYEHQWDELHAKVMFLDSRLTEAARDVQVLKDDLQEQKLSKNVVMSEEVQSEAREEHHTKAMSPDGKLTNAEEEVEPMKDDIVKPEVLSENIVLSEEVQSEAQGHSSPLHNVDGGSDPTEEVPKV